jgi:hypothetical protein
VRSAARRLLLVAPLAVALLFAVAYLLVDAWLESAGGRHAVERALAERIGLPVRLDGDFNVMLLPSVGVSGTELVLGEPGPATEVARSHDYAVTLALAPLFESRLLIESVRFTDGVLHLGRWPGRSAAAGTPLPGAPVLPDISELAVRNFTLAAGDGADSAYLLKELSIEEFTPGWPAPLRLELEGFGEWTGNLAWQPERATLAVNASGRGPWPGELRARAEWRLNEGAGDVAASWIDGPFGSAVEPRLALAVASLPAGLRVQAAQLEADALRVAGDGCLLTGRTTALHLELASDRLDVDALPDLAALAAPPSAEGAGQASAGWPEGVDFNVRLSVGELLAGGAVARQAVLRLGGEPDCGSLAAADRN